MAVHLDRDSNIQRIEPFLAGRSLQRPVDMKLGPQGELYVLEYGETWGPNADSRLLKVVYNRGNRAPQARASAEGNIGKGPLEVRLFSAGSQDPDVADALHFEWRREPGGPVVSTEANPGVRFEKPGVYNVELTVLDRDGAAGRAQVPVLVGNSPPQLEFREPQPNSFFFWDRPLPVKVMAFDLEDDEFVQKVLVRARLREPGQQEDRLPPGFELMRRSDCLNCHAVGSKIVGPALQEIALRYRGDNEALDRSAQRVLAGSAGVWSEVPMLPHPQHSLAEARLMVEWVLGLGQGDSDPVDSLSANSRGFLNLSSRPKDKPAGNFVLTATYTDRGAAPVGPLTGSAEVVVRSPRIEAEHCAGHDRLNIGGNNDGGKGQRNLGATLRGSWASYPAVNLAGVTRVICRASSDTTGGQVEFRQGSREGPILGTVEVTPTGDWAKYQNFEGTLKDPGGTFDLYITFNGPQDHMMNLNWFEFAP